jgi:DUF1009 family protein
MADRKLAVIAGAGALPRLMVGAARAQGLRTLVVAFHGHTDAETVAGVDHFWSHLGRVGTVLRRLKAEGVTDLVMAGAIRRPRLHELRPDWYTARFFLRLGHKALGDDGLLRSIAALMETEGFRVLGAHDLAETVLAPAGLLGQCAPDEIQHRDIAQGITVARTLGALDIGQAVVVQQGVVLGVEGIEGTDGLIARIASLARAGSKPVLVKLCKPQQDMRIDLPAIGAKTLAAAAAAGLGGIAVEAGRTILLDSETLPTEADRLGLFVMGLNVDRDKGAT